MGLDTILKPFKWVDEQILRSYTEFGEKSELDKDRRKYIASTACWIAYMFICINPGQKLFGSFDLPVRIALTLPDYLYSNAGLWGMVHDDSGDDIKKNHFLIDVYRGINSVVRLPAFLTGTGFVAKYAADFVSLVVSGEPIDPMSDECLRYGVGLLLLASSMYIKEMDPKLLEKDPAWMQALNYVKEKLSVPSIPQTTQPYSTIDIHVIE